MPEVTSPDDKTKNSVARAPRDDRRDRAAAVRFCALTHRERPASELLRFVAGPDERIYLDLARRLPGRGVWITADHQSISAAIKSKAFRRSLKKQVTVPPDLADAVKRLCPEMGAPVMAPRNRVRTLSGPSGSTPAAVSLRR